MPYTNKPTIVTKEQLSEQIATIIRNWIITLKLKPGERLIVDTLSEKTGVSRTPIREGLRSLAGEGFVVYNGKSYYVKNHSRLEINDIFAVRRVLEILSARQAAERIKEESLTTIRNICTDYEKRLEEHNIEILIDHDLRFHRQIVMASDNTYLQSILPRLNEQCWWISQRIFGSKPEYYTGKNTVKAHWQIYESLCQHDGDKVAKVIERHLRSGEERKLEILDRLLLDRVF